MLTLLLAEAELERVPQSITGHAQVVAAARHAGVASNKMLLDASVHHAAMRNLDDGGRRGRPDLVHFFLLTGLESRLNKQGRLRLLVHTREGYLLRIDPSTRLVRNFNRFCGLIQQLFETGKVPPDKPLLTLEPGWSVRDVVAAQKADRVLILDETGPSIEPWDVFGPEDGTRHVLAVIGGFPSGTFRGPLPEGDRVAFGSELLTVWSVASELLVHYEHVAAAVGKASA